MINKQDHAKWGVSIGKNYICYGDLNRNPSQKLRSGTIACFNHNTVAKHVKKIIKSYEDCPVYEALKFLE